MHLNGYVGACICLSMHALYMDFLDSQGLMILGYVQLILGYFGV